MKENSTMIALLSNLLIISFIFAFSYPANAALDKSLLLYFSFDKGSGGTVIDESGNGNDGTLKGNVKWVNDGNIRGAVSFDRSAGTCIEVPDNKVLDSLTKSITVEAWVKTNKTNFNDDQIIGKYANPQPSETWLLFIAISDYAAAQGGTSPNAFGFVASPTSGWDDAAYVVGASKTFPEAGKWYHVAGTFDHKTGTLKIYVNGKLDGERKTGADKIGTNDQPLTIGGNPNMDPGYNCWDGVIDEVAIYNRALTEAEIQKDMIGITLAVEPGEKAAATWGSIKRKYCNGN